MAEDKQKTPQFADFLTALYDDPLRPETSRRGRWVVALSLAQIWILLLGAKFRSSAILPIDIPEHALAVPSLLSVIIFLLAVEFCFRAFTDAFRAREVEVLIVKFLAATKLERLYREAKAVDDRQPDPNEEEADDEPDLWWRAYFIADDEQRVKIAELEEGLGERSTPRRIRSIRGILEITVPLFSGAFALALYAVNLL